MKYSVQQIEQALKDGKTIFFHVPYGDATEYEATLCPNPGLVTAKWLDECGEPTSLVYKLTSLVGAFNNGWTCTKIEGEDIMEKKTTPHKHAELIKKWADGGIIQYKSRDEEWRDCSDNLPFWESDIKYRVKPTLVKKWKWVYEPLDGNMIVTCIHYSSPEEFYNLNPYNQGMILQKIDSTMIEVEE